MVCGTGELSAEFAAHFPSRNVTDVHVFLLRLAQPAERRKAVDKVSGCGMSAALEIRNDPDARVKGGGCGADGGFQGRVPIAISTSRSWSTGSVKRRWNSAAAVCLNRSHPASPRWWRINLPCKVFSRIARKSAIVARIRYTTRRTLTLVNPASWKAFSRWPGSENHSSQGMPSRVASASASLTTNNSARDCQNSRYSLRIEPQAVTPSRPPERRSLTMSGNPNSYEER